QPPPAGRGPPRRAARGRRATLPGPPGGPPRRSRRAARPCGRGPGHGAARPQEEEEGVTDTLPPGGQSGLDSGGAATSTKASPLCPTFQPRTAPTAPGGGCLDGERPLRTPARAPGGPGCLYPPPASPAPAGGPPAALALPRLAAALRPPDPRALPRRGRPLGLPAAHPGSGPA